jgi:hypothetical protein
VETAEPRAARSESERALKLEVDNGVGTETEGTEAETEAGVAKEAARLRRVEGTVGVRMGEVVWGRASQNSMLVQGE